MLDRAEPRVGNSVASPPRELKLWFTQKLEQAFSTVTVTDASGQRVDTGKARIDGNQMGISLRVLAPEIEAWALAESRELDAWLDRLATGAGDITD